MVVKRFIFFGFIKLYKEEYRGYFIKVVKLYFS